jgi:DNA invertase Pin-like site-specific DNA recombinase
MDRLGRNLDDLRRMVLGLTARGVHVRFVKESLIFTGEDSPMANLLLSVMGAFAQFERELVRERQREGIELAKKAGAYRRRKHSLTMERARSYGCDSTRAKTSRPWRENSEWTGPRSIVMPRMRAEPEHDSSWSGCTEVLG